MNYSAPTLIVVGKDDFVYPPSHAKFMHEGIPNSELVATLLEDHLAHLEEPEAFFEAPNPFRFCLRLARYSL
jgi:proline iminopeptidase